MVREPVRQAGFLANRSCGRMVRKARQLKSYEMRRLRI